MILTLDDVAADVFLVADAESLSNDQASIAAAALKYTHAVLFAFLRQNTQYGLVVDVLTAGESNERPHLLPQEQVLATTDRIVTSRIPVRVEGLAVKINESQQSFDDSAELAIGVDYQLEDVVDGWSTSGVLRRLRGQWPLLPGGVEVRYTGGQDASNPAADWSIIRSAAMIVFRAEFAKVKAFVEHSRKTGSSVLTSESIGKYSRSLDQSSLKAALGQSDQSLPPDAAILLIPLIRIGAFL